MKNTFSIQRSTVMCVVEILVYSLIRNRYSDAGAFDSQPEWLRGEKWTISSSLQFVQLTVNPIHTSITITYVMGLLPICSHSCHFEMGIGSFFGNQFVGLNWKLHCWSRSVYSLDRLWQFSTVKNKWTRQCFCSNFILSVMWLMDIEFECSGLCHERNGFFFFSSFRPNETNQNELCC